MTIISTTAPTTASASSNVTALVAELGGNQSEVQYMLGIGLNKESDAVYFNYLGDDNEPAALMLASGKPVTKLPNVVITGLSLYEPGDRYNTLKLNLFLETNSGTQILVTSGLTTMWSQCVINGLMALFNGGDFTCPFDLESWKGSQGVGTYFAAVKVGGVKMSDDQLYKQLCEARADRNDELKRQIMRDSVEILSHAVSGGPIEPVVVSTTEKTEVVPADF